ncbi:MAG TPA: T9SS type A sorting domain-containing protein [Paludibacter sp.]
MKTNLTVLLLTLIWLNGFSQAEFAPIGAEWYYSKTESFNPPQIHYMKHTCIKDSTIADKRVKVIQKTLFKYGGVAVNLGYEYLYQHSDTIFYWKSGEFHVLYNFSLAKGDSLLLYSEMPNQCEDKTPYGWSSIDSVYFMTINSHQLKAYSSTHMKGSIWGFDSFPIIEKIGSTQYLLPQNAFCGIMDGEPQIGVLRCYSDPEIGNFQYVNVPCDKITSWPDSFIQLNMDAQFKLYPNPVVDELTIEYNDSRDTWFNLDIFDLTGKLIYSRFFRVGEKIDLSALQRGWYPIIIYNNKLYYNGNVYKN